MTTKPLRILTLALASAGLAACASQQEVKLPPPPKHDEPYELIGFAAPKLRTLFGAPSFVRKDGVAEIWRYDGAACKAFFFLYSQDGALEVRHVETLPRGVGRPIDTNCLDALRVTPPSQPVS